MFPIKIAGDRPHWQSQIIQIMLKLWVFQNWDPCLNHAICADWAKEKSTISDPSCVLRVNASGFRASSRNRYYRPNLLFTYTASECQRSSHVTRWNTMFCVGGPPSQVLPPLCSSIGYPYPSNSIGKVWSETIEFTVNLPFLHSKCNLLFAQLPEAAIPEREVRTGKDGDSEMPPGNPSP